MKGFTLIELLVVISIMGLLGTASVAGYRQMQQGMEERGVRQNVENFLTAAAARAQIDRMPTVVYYWNETVRWSGDDDTETDIIVGHAVAVRRHGRITEIDGQLLIDEFGDLTPSDSDVDDPDAGTKDVKIRLYRLDGTSGGNVDYTLVYANPRKATERILQYLTYDPASDAEIPNEGGSDAPQKGYVRRYGYASAEGVNGWKVGSAYGFEFLSLTLPHGYLLGNSYSTKAGDPLSTPQKIVFKPDDVSGSVKVYAWRPQGTGAMGATDVGTCKPDTKDLK